MYNDAHDIVERGDLYQIVADMTGIPRSEAKRKLMTGDTSQVNPTHFNRLTPGEDERLATLAEEAGEIIQVVGKTLRHGFESTHPKGGQTNRARLLDEVLDLFAVVTMMTEAGDLPELTAQHYSDEIEARIARKLRFAHHQEK